MGSENPTRGRRRMAITGKGAWQACYTESIEIASLKETKA